MNWNYRNTEMGAGVGDYVCITFDSLSDEQPTVTGWVRAIPEGVVASGGARGASLLAAQEGRALGIRLASAYWVSLSHANIAEVKVLKPGETALWKPEPIEGDSVLVDKDGVLIPATRASKDDPWHMPSRGLWFESDTDLRAYAGDGIVLAGD